MGKCNFSFSLRRQQNKIKQINNFNRYRMVYNSFYAEYCGFRSWNLVMNSTRIVTSSIVMALYMAARTPPTNLQTNKYNN